MTKTLVKMEYFMNIPWLYLMWVHMVQMAIQLGPISCYASHIMSNSHLGHKFLFETHCCFVTFFVTFPQIEVAVSRFQSYVQRCGLVQGFVVDLVTRRCGGVGTIFVCSQCCFVGLRDAHTPHI